jgi:energy-coupling factor transporter ATP-binding protein EcfA2
VPDVDVVVSSPVDLESVRVNQVGAVFDCPLEKRQQLRFNLSVPIEENPWSVGLIVGPSGSGKSTVARHMFGEEVEPSWGTGAVVDDFDPSMSVQEIATICGAVGFNTIPAWLRPFHVLSNGEKFRVDVARRLSESGDDPILIDEFTSVVDRQVAQIASHAVQKQVRRTGKQLVAATCHYDVIDWLQPDWIVDMATREFTWRSVRRRPELNAEIRRVPRSLWSLFAPYHYMSANLHVAAKCWGLFVDGKPAAFIGNINRVGKGFNDVYAISRCVCLPDFQGLGLAFVLMERVAAMYKTLGFRLRAYPAHPPFIRSFNRSDSWRLFARRKLISSSRVYGNITGPNGDQGREGATFQYCGPAHPDIVQAERMYREPVK